MDALEQKLMQLPQIVGEGWKTANLCQRQDGRWQANIYNPAALAYGGWGYGDTPSKAIDMAIAAQRNVPTPKPKKGAAPVQPQINSNSPDNKAAPEMGDADEDPFA